MEVDPLQRMLGYFEYGHLPVYLQEISKPCCILAMTMVDTVPMNNELLVGLRKLLEAKDCFIRATIL